MDNINIEYIHINQYTMMFQIMKCIGDCVIFADPWNGLSFNNMVLFSFLLMDLNRLKTHLLSYHLLCRKYYYYYHRERL